MTEQGTKPGYWAVIPSQVRYDPDIPPSAKLLYAEISSLTDLRGYCYATNAYFEQLYGLSERTVIRLIKILMHAGYIRVEDNEGGKTQRKIYAGINPLSETPDKNVSTPRQKCQYPPDKNVTQTNKENDLSDQIPPKAPQGAGAGRKRSEWEPEMFERFWAAYPNGRDKAKARAEWDKLKPDRKLMETMSAALDKAKASDEWQRGIGIPYACRWLSHRRWEDELDKSVPDADLYDPAERKLAGDRC